jgi:hypothetical protein
MNRSIARSDDQRTPATVELAVNFALANLALGGDRHIKIDMAITGVQVNVRRQFARDFKRNVPIAGL